MKLCFFVLIELIRGRIVCLQKYVGQIDLERVIIWEVLGLDDYVFDLLMFVL